MHFAPSVKVFASNKILLPFCNRTIYTYKKHRLSAHLADNSMAFVSHAVLLFSINTINNIDKAHLAVLFEF